MQQSTADHATTKGRKSRRYVLFRGTPLQVSFRRYSNNHRTAICLEDIETGEPYGTATVNIPDIPLKSSEVLIKNYSENAGMFEALERAGIVRYAGRCVRSGFVEIPVCELLVNIPAGNANAVFARRAESPCLTRLRHRLRRVRAKTSSRAARVEPAQ